MINVSSNLQTQLDKQHIAPELRVSVYNTTKSVPSNGFDVTYYTFDDNADLSGTWTTGATSVLSGNEFSTVMSFDWGEGSPPPVSQVDNYGAVWTGYFFARYSGVYTFYVDSGPLCGAQIKFDGSYLNFSDGTTSGSPWYGGDLQGSSAELYASTPALTSGSWYAIQIEFFTGSNKDGTSPAHFTVKYQEPSGAVTSLNEFGESYGFSDYESDPAKKPLSAGVVNSASGFLTGTELTGITEYELDRPFSEVAQAAFSVNLSWASTLDRTTTATGSVTTVYVDSTEGAPSAGVLEINGVTHVYTEKTSVTFTLETAADILSTSGVVVKLKDTPYSYDRTTGTFGNIKAFRLVRFEVGMNDGSGNTYYVDRLWGNIYPDPMVSRDKTGVNSLKVLVQDFSSNMNVDYNKNYPNQSSYSMAGYYDGATYGKGPNGQTRPYAYDGWTMDGVMRDLAIKANIDPVWMYRRRNLYNGSGFADSYSGYLVRGEDINLEKKPLYGNPDNIGEDEADDEYIWAFGYGETLLSIAYTLCKNFGYGFSFLEDGSMSFNGMDVPQEKLFALNYSTGGSVVIADDTDWTKTANMTSLKGNDMVTSTSGETILFTSSGRYVDLVLTRDQASGATVTLQVDSVDVTSVTMDGTDQTLVGGILDISYSGSWSYFDGVNPNTGVNHSVVRIDMGDYDEHELSVELTSGTMKVAGVFLYDILSTDSVLDIDTRDIEKLDDRLSFVDMRNEVVVVGSLLGKFQDTGGNVINPRNPIYRHVTSSAIDLNSLYDTSQKNYIGRVVPFEIYNPKIFSKDRADYLSTAILEKYRAAHHTPEFDVRPNPRIQVLDSVTLNDIGAGLTTSSDTLWVVGYSESLKAGDGSVRYDMNTRITGHKPLLSFEVKDEPSIDDFGGSPVVNVYVKNAGKRICGSGSATALVWNVDYSPGWDTDMWKGHELIIQGGRWLIVSNDADSLTVHSDSPALPAGTKNSAISYDPFDSDRGKPLEIHYDQVITGKVIVKIRTTGPRIVNSINSSKEDEVEDWGAGKVLYWDGYDNRNNALMNSDELMVIDFFVVAGDSKVYHVGTSEDLSTYVEEMLFGTKILNHGLYAEIQPIGVDDDNETVWVGSVTHSNFTDDGSYLYLQDSGFPADASGWSGAIEVDKRAAPAGLTDTPGHLTIKLPIFSYTAATKTFKLYRDPGGVMAPQPATFWSTDTGDLAYRIFNTTGSNSYANGTNFALDDNSRRGMGIKINPVSFYTKWDKHVDPLVLRKVDYDESGYDTPINKVKANLPDLEVHYDGDDYTPTYSADWSPIPHTGWVEDGDEKFESCPVFYWRAWDNKIPFSSIHTYFYGGFNTTKGAMSQAYDLDVPSESTLGPEMQFSKLRQGLFPLYTAWPENFADDSPKPVLDFPLSFAHHNYLAPTKATPAPFGKLVVRAVMDRYCGGEIETSEEEEIYNSGGVINLDQKEIYFNPTDFKFGSDQIGGFDYAPKTFPDDLIAWRVRFYVDIYDRAGRKSGNCRPGIIRRNGSSFNYYNNASNYFEAWWFPITQSDYTGSWIMTTDPVATDSAKTRINLENIKLWEKD